MDLEGDMSLMKSCLMLLKSSMMMMVSILEDFSHLRSSRSSLSTSPCSRSSTSLNTNIVPGNCFQCNSTMCMTIPCNIDGLCKLCYTQEQIDKERTDARRKTQKQADKMLKVSRTRFGDATVGDTVLLAIPDL